MEMDTTGNCEKARLNFTDTQGAIITTLCEADSNQQIHSPPNSDSLNVMLHTLSDQNSNGFHLHYYFEGKYISQFLKEMQQHLLTVFQKTK